MRPSASPTPLTAHSHVDERKLPPACLCVDRNSHAIGTARTDGVVIDQSLGQIAEYLLIRPSDFDSTWALRSQSYGQLASGSFGTTSSADSSARSALIFRNEAKDCSNCVIMT